MILTRIFPPVCPCLCCYWPCTAWSQEDPNVPYSSPFLQRSPRTYGQLNSIPMNRVPVNGQTPPNSPSSTCDLFDHHSSTTPCESFGSRRTPSHTMLIVLVVIYLALVIAVTFFVYFCIDKHFVYLISKWYNAVRFASF